ncbi:MAG TPA: ABC transporter ATP-binding protein [Bacillota bacterium]|nr:ABC transporter ATP-binding protein [Bacillota bacterium]
MAANPTPGTAVTVQMEGICKSFGPVKALDGVSLTVDPGEIRALVGENGAGKTTLMAILYGMVRPDRGQLRIAARDVSRDWSPRRAMSAGIGMIHQHFSLIQNHSVLENVLMPQLRWTQFRPAWSHHRRMLQGLCEQYGFALPLDGRVETLSVGQQQQVEILKMLYQGASFLIMDEPTAVLTPQQTEALLDLLLRLRAQGHTVVLITHKLAEAFAVADNITVLRRGLHIVTVPCRHTTPQTIAGAMVEREWSTAADLRVPDREPSWRLELKDLVVGEDHRPPAVDRVSLAIRPREIVGVAGVAGNGQTELAEALVGLRQVRGGAIKLAEQDIAAWPIARRLKAGLRHIPENRHFNGMVGDLTLAENLILDRSQSLPFSARGVLNRRAIGLTAAGTIADYDVRTPSAEVPMSNLSGGNQQRVVVARALAAQPQVVIACQPTRGLDIAATAYIRRRLVQCATDGAAILLISSEIEELTQLCHRILVMYRGRVVGELESDRFDIPAIGLLMSGQGGPCAADCGREGDGQL